MGKGQPVAEVNCAIGDSSDPFHANASVTMFPCLKPTANITMEVDINGEDHGPYDISPNESVLVPLGDDVTVKIQGHEVSAGVYLSAEINGSAEKLVATIYLELCATIFGQKLCGEALGEDAAYAMVEGTITTTGIC